MSAAPAFELTLSLGTGERSVLALIVAVTAAALAAWLGSHVGARVAVDGYAAWAWLAVTAAAGAGGWIGWSVAVPRSCMLRWHQDRWTWVDARSNVEHVGSVEPRLDLGSWILLTLRGVDGAGRWAAVGRQRAGAAWHPLRATLFAPVRRSVEPRTGESAPR